MKKTVTLGFLQLALTLMTFEAINTDKVVTWITDVDEEKLWPDFLKLVDDYQRTHKMKKQPYGRLTFGMP